MIESRQPHTLGEWLQYDYFRRPRGLRRAARWPLFLGAVAALGVFGVLHGLGQRAVFQAGELSVAHAQHSSSCEVCHRESFNVWQRLLPGHGGIRSVRDEDCLSCHRSEPHQQVTASGSTSLSEPACVTCHREHQGKIDLARASTDGACLACHSDLSVRVPRSTFADVGRFPEAHPEFRGTEFRTPSGAVQRNAYAIKFDHQKHLDLDQISESELTRMLPQLYAEIARAGQGQVKRPLAQLLLAPVAAATGALSSDPVLLRTAAKCAACHETDASGQRMLPVRFDAHCASCHPLTVTVAGSPAWDEPLRSLVPRVQEPAPHLAPPLVRAALRQRFVEFATAHPQILSEPIEPARRIQLFPRREPVEVPPQAVEAWANGQLRLNEAALFASEASGVTDPSDAGKHFSTRGQGCFLCHTATGGSESGLPQLEPSRLSAVGGPSLSLPAPLIPNSWWPHAEFNHEKHRTMNCLDCHGGIPTATRTDPNRVHLPDKAQCASCHNPVVGVRASCIDCHRYHHGSVTGQGNAPLLRSHRFRGDQPAANQKVMP